MKLFHRIGLCLAAAAAMFLTFGMQAHAQQQTLKGVVIDQNGEPIIGAAVFVVETNKGEITDIVKGKVDFPQIGFEKGTTERGFSKVSKSV